MGPVQEAPWRQHPVNLSLGNDSESPHGGRSSRGIYSPQFKEDTKGQSRPANAPASKASWGGFSDCSFKTKHPSGNTGYSGRIGNCSVACGVAVLVLEGGNPGSQQGDAGGLTLTTPGSGPGFVGLGPSCLPPGLPHSQEGQAWPLDAPLGLRSPKLPVGHSSAVLWGKHFKLCVTLEGPGPEGSHRTVRASQVPCLAGFNEKN